MVSKPSATFAKKSQNRKTPAPQVARKAEVQNPKLLQRLAEAPASVSPEEVGDLQRWVGNRAVTQALGQATPATAATRQPAAAPVQRSALLPTLRRGSIGVLQRAPVIANEERRATMSRLLTEHQTHLALFVNEAKRSQNTALANSAQWFEAGGGHTLYALVPTHDSEGRAAAAGKAGHVAYFGYPQSSVKPNLARELYNSPCARNDAPRRDENISYDRPTVAGFNDTQGGIAIMNPKDRSDDELAATLIHEVQHSADRHAQETTRQGYAPGSREKALEGYKTEFRAYSLQPTGGPANEIALLPVTGLELRIFGHGASDLPNTWSRRQWTIFRHLYDSPSYAYVKQAWDAEEGTRDVNARWFQQRVLNYAAFESLNPNNNLALDKVYTALENLAGARPATESNPQVQNLLNVLLPALDRPAAEKLLASEVWGRVTPRLNAFVVRALRCIVNPIAGQPAPGPLAVDETLPIRDFLVDLESVDPMVRFGGGYGLDSPKVRGLIQDAGRLSASDATQVKASDRWRRMKEDTKKYEDRRANTEKIQEYQQVLESNEEALTKAYDELPEKPDVAPDKEGKIELVLQNTVWGKWLMGNRFGGQMSTGYTTEILTAVEAALDQVIQHAALLQQLQDYYN